MTQKPVRRRKKRGEQKGTSTNALYSAFGMHRPMPGQLDVLYEDEHTIVVNKQAGVPVTPDRFSPSPDTLTNRVWHYLWQQRGGNPALLHETRPRLVHRLDRDTSGIIIYAKTESAQRELTRQFEKRRVLKTYLVVVEGRVEERSGRIDYPIGPPPRLTHATRGRMFIGTPKAKPAITDFKLLEAHSSWSLLEVHPRTGRTHQIRLHLSAYGHPLIVDPLYGKRDKLYLSDLRPLLGREDVLIIERLSMHAAKISFLKVSGDGKRSGERIELEAPIPQDFKRLLDVLRTEVAD